MSSMTLSNDDLAQSERPAWSAVFAMALCVFVPIASEFMPVSLLSPIARDLALTEGQAGQAISISGIFAVVASLFITVAIGRSDRRIVLIALTGMMIVSGTTVAFAPNYGTADGRTGAAWYRDRRLLVAFRGYNHATGARRFSFAGAGHHLWRQRARVCDRSSSGQLYGWARRLERCVLLRRSISGHRPDLAAFDASPASGRETVRSR